MRPYNTIKPIEHPDILDITTQARASHVGRLPGKSGDFKPYAVNPKTKAQTRRNLKRRDRQAVTRQIAKDEQ